MRKAILIRVGIDQSKDSGRWNGPSNPENGDFVYVPIQQTKTDNIPGMEKYYTDRVVPALQNFSERNGCNVILPEHLMDKRMHLDPDFDYLTYGDTATRGKKLSGFKESDLVVFFAGLRPIKPIAYDKLIYALIGILVVQELVRVKDIADHKRFDENAHTRNSPANSTDLVVRGKQNISGRLKRCIPIGEYRSKAYRVTLPLLEEWGGLSVNDGYLQRSANPPMFNDPDSFFNWFQKQNPQLVQANNS